MQQHITVTCTSTNFLIHHNLPHLRPPKESEMGKPSIDKGWAKIACTYKDFTSITFSEWSCNMLYIKFLETTKYD